MSGKTMPNGWVETSLGEIARLNPRGWSTPPGDSQPVSFVPMAAIEAGTGRMSPAASRPWGAVKKGYATFEDGDVLFARVTPCMENGKCALAQGLLGGRGAGSTELFVLRPTEAVEARYLLHYLLQRSFRREARAAMQGVGGLLRVRPELMTHARVPLPPKPEQLRIVEAIEQSFAQLESGVAALGRVQANLKRHRASVLKAAFEGRLVPSEAELAREEQRDYEPSQQLLARIRQERRARWEARQLAKMKAAGKAPRDDTWRAKYKAPEATVAQPHEALPEGWAWASWEQVAFSQNGRSFPSDAYTNAGVRLLRPGNLHGAGAVRWTGENTRHLAERFAEEHPDLLVREGELVMNLTAQSLKDEFLGRVCVTGPGERCLLNQRLARLTPVGVDSSFCLWLLKSRGFRRFVDGLNKGSLIQHIFTSQLDQFVFALPPLAEQLRIVAEIERRLSAADQLDAVSESSTRRADRLRQAILKRAFEGRLVSRDPGDTPTP